MQCGSPATNTRVTKTKLSKYMPHQNKIVIVPMSSFDCIVGLWNGLVHFNGEVFNKQFAHDGGDPMFLASFGGTIGCSESLKVHGHSATITYNKGSKCT